MADPCLSPGSVLGLALVSLVGLAVLGLPADAWAADPASSQPTSPTARLEAALEANGATLDDLRTAEEPAAPAGILGPVVSVDVVALDGDPAPGGGGGATFASLNPPMTNGRGHVGFTGSIEAGGSTVNFVWFDDQIVWRNTDAVGFTLSGAESVMGIADDGSWFYSPSTDGEDSVWSDNGLVAVENTAAPDQTPPTTSTFHSRPQMDDDGTAYWVAGLNDTGGTASEARALYRSDGAVPGTITTVFRSGDVIDGQTLSSGSSGVDFDYDFSSDGDHHIHVLDMATGSTANDLFVYVDGSLVAQESTATGAGDNWGPFDQVSINAFGDHLWSGDTDGATATDEYIAYNGVIAVREGDAVDGVALASTASVRAATINDLGEAVHAWGVSGGVEHVFFATDASNLLTSSVRVLSTGDVVDVDGNGVADATVTDLNTFGPSIELSVDGRLFLEVDLDFGGGAGEQEAIIALELPRGDKLIVNEANIDDGPTDTAEYVEIRNAGSTNVSLATVELVLVDGTGSAYDTVSLPATVLAPDELFVVCADAAEVANCDLDVTPDTDWIQDSGPAAIALQPAGMLAGGPVIDTVSYGGAVPGPYTEDAPAGVDSPATANASLSRIGDVDSDQNDQDFAQRCGSPGEDNLDTTAACDPVPVELMHFEVE